MLKQANQTNWRLIFCVAFAAIDSEFADTLAAYQREFGDRIMGREMDEPTMGREMDEPTMAERWTSRPWPSDRLSSWD